MPILDWLPHVRSTTGVAAGLSLAYLCLVRSLRWRRFYAIHREYGHRIRTLTPAEAQKILHVSMLYDTPGLFTYALTFALFKTYAIPSISKLLLQTRQLSSENSVARRYADTEILIGTWLTCPILGTFNLEQGAEKGRDPRANIAIARTNWLHSQHKISNDDYLYTLSLFVLEPLRWISRYEWRALSELEQQAYFVFWRDVGRRMGIRDIPESLAALTAWSTDYEERAMVPAESNMLVAEFTIGELQRQMHVPRPLRPLARRLVVTAVDERTRTAMMLPVQPWYLHLMTKTALYSVGFFHRYLSLPRVFPKSTVPPDHPVVQDGKPARMHPSRWASTPWYKPEQHGFSAALDRILISLHLVDAHQLTPRPEYRMEGYRLEELGPLAREKHGHAEVMKMASELQGCPVSGIWATAG